jgi:hypothetical protein
MATATRFRPTRRPALRVVSPELPGNRHATIWDFAGATRLIEVWSFDEWDRLPAELRPEKSGFLPGIGFISIRMPLSQMEEEDVIDVRSQAEEQYRLERAIEY